MRQKKWVLLYTRLIKVVCQWKWWHVQAGHVGETNKKDQDS